MFDLNEIYTNLFCQIDPFIPELRLTSEQNNQDTSLDNGSVDGLISSPRVCVNIEGLDNGPFHGLDHGPVQVLDQGLGQDLGHDLGHALGQVLEQDHKQDDGNNSRLDHVIDQDHDLESGQGDEIDGAKIGNFKIDRVFKNFSKKYDCNQTTYKISFPTIISTFEDGIFEINEIFKNLHSKLQSLLKPKDIVRVAFSHSSFPDPVNTPFMSKEDLSEINFLNYFGYIVQSYKTFEINRDNSFFVNIIVAHLPYGTRKRKNLFKKQPHYIKKAKNLKNYKSHQDFCNKNRFIINVINNDNLCGLRAVIIALAYEQKDPKRYQIAKPNSIIIQKKIDSMIKNCNLDLHSIQKYGVSIDEFKKIENYLKIYQITVIKNDGKIDSVPIYKGELHSYTSKFLYLSFTGSHYNVINSMKRFTNYRYYCHLCKKGYSNINSHNCSFICKACKREKCAPTACQLDLINYYSGSNSNNTSDILNTLGNNINISNVSNTMNTTNTMNTSNTMNTHVLNCKQCGFFCNNQICYNIHVEKICLYKQMCSKCGSFKRARHVCGENEKWCLNCKQSVDYAHKCFILREDEKTQKKPTKLNGYIFFDYEAYLSNNIHVPNLIIAVKININCIDKCMNLNEHLKDCDYKCKMVSFEDNITFCDWLFEQEYFIAMAHNFKGYDSVFVMNYLIDSFTSIDSKPKILLNGTKIISIKFRKVKIIDSYSFIDISLEKFSDTFQIRDFKKLYFPYLFNIPANQSYVGKVPDKKYFNYELLDESRKIEFDIWYEKRKENIYNFKYEFETYCRNDVCLLALGCIAFRKIIINVTKLSENDKGIDPFLCSTTMPSLSHYIFRRNFMKSKSIGIIPPNGYNPEQIASIKAINWLKFIALKNNCFIQHAKNIGEYRVGKYRIDGICIASKTVYEFHGCFFHGCQKCYNSNTWNNIKQSTMGYIYQKHLNRLEFIKKCLPDFNIVEMWECVWNLELKKNEELIKFIKILDIREPLNPRQALYGGRNNAFKLYHKCQMDEKIFNYDVNSLYPFIQFSKSFPIGHPTIITENFGYIEQYFGIIYCKILPPKNLDIPVLPDRINSKLIFTLCKRCAILNSSNCTHSDEDRCLEGTWVTVEVIEALKYGYKLIKIYEIWHWDEASNDLWKGYVSLFYNEKQKAELNNNTGLKSVLKWLLNCLWGRYGMNLDKTHVKIINNLSDWISMMLNKNYKIQNIDFSHDSNLIVYYSFEKEYFGQNNEISVVLAAFVTCYARLFLFNELVKLKRRVLYFDTDSIIFVSNSDSEYKPQIGRDLGMFKDVLNGNGSKWIVEFVSGGCKNYGYEENDGNKKCVIKGFSINNVVKLILNFEAIKNITTSNKTKKIEIEQLKFSRDKYNWKISSNYIKKLYSLVYDKRILNDDYTTHPFGFDKTLLKQY
jgi:hypothetical protein